MAAATLVVLIVVAAVVLSGDGADDGPGPRAAGDDAPVGEGSGPARTSTGESDDPVAPVDPDPRFASEPATSGWYLPPEGWEMIAVSSDVFEGYYGGACPCSFLAATRPGELATPLDIWETERGQLPAGLTDLGFEPVEVGGRPGWQSPPMTFTGARMVLVPLEWGLLAASMGADDVDVGLTVVDAWLDRREAGEEVDVDGLPLPAGWIRSGLVKRPAVSYFHLVSVLVRQQATGRVIEYQLAPTGYNRRWLQTPAVAEGAEGALRLVYPDTDRLLYRDGPEQPSAGAPGRVVAARMGGPVDVVVGDNYFGDNPLDSLSETEVVAFLEGLRLVETEEWRAALPSDSIDRSAQGSPSLFDPPLTQP
ncbi:MAG TPA: hypothetical protein VEW93_06525 [Acidimicrobiales bacterium]|nr:hypothetical protein [Acidimicrobiales bacterium]